MVKVVHTYVNRELCLAHGMCEHVAPNVFELPDDDPTARVKVTASMELDTDAENIREAALSCPVKAIVVVYSDGSILGDPSAPDAAPMPIGTPSRPWLLYVILSLAVAALGWFARAATI